MTKFDKLLTEADKLIGDAARLARNPLARVYLRDAQFALDDASTREAQQRIINFGSRTPTKQKV